MAGLIRSVNKMSCEYSPLICITNLMIIGRNNGVQGTNTMAEYLTATANRKEAIRRVNLCEFTLRFPVVFSGDDRMKNKTELSINVT